MHAVSAASCLVSDPTWSLPARLVCGRSPTLTLASLLAFVLLSAGCSTSAVRGGREEAAAAPEDRPTTPPSAMAPPRVPPGALTGEFVSAEIATVGWDRFTSSPLVLLRDLDSGQVVPIWVGVAEARAIAMALHEVDFPRPLTHDLMVHLIHELGAELDEVVVHDLVDGTYLGVLKLRVEGRDQPLLMDTRPSDGLALAARTGAAISIARKILDDSPEYEFLAPEGADQVVRFSGLTLMNVTSELRQEFGLPDREGLVVTRAVGAAARQGLKRGDLIIEVHGIVPSEPMDFLDAVEDIPPGIAVPLTYWRGGEEHEVELEPEAPAFPSPADAPKPIA